MFEPKVHRVTEPFQGNAEAALDLARTALVSQGFEILEDSGAELRAQGPGMHSNRQSPLLGVTEFSFRVGSSTLAISATLGGVARMRTFVMLFPPLLGVAVSLPSILAGTGNPWHLPLWVVPWLVISPLLASAIERSTVRAVDGLARGMTQVAARK